MPTRTDVGLRRDNRVVRSPSRSKTLTVVAEGGVEYGLQHFQQCLLDQPIRDRRDAMLALATVRFGNQHPSYRTGPVRAPQQLVTNQRPCGDKVAFGLVNIQTIDTSGPFVRFDPIPCSLEVLYRQRRQQQRRPCVVGGSL